MKRRSPVMQALLARGRGRGYQCVPLVRFLRSRRGRRWQAVHAEFCAALPGGRMARELRELLAEFVCERVVRRDDTLFALKDKGPRPLYSRPGHAVGARFYVHPGDGTLREAPRPPRAPTPDAPPTRIDRGPAGVYIKADGIWYAAELRRVGRGTTPFDTWLRAPATVQNADARRTLYGRPRAYAVSKRQLDRRSLRRAGLENDR